MIRFGHQECRFRALTSQEAFGVGGDKNYRYFKGAQKVIYGVQSRTAIGQLDICENQSRPFPLRNLECLIARPSHPDDAMAKTFHEALEIEGYQSFVFDDEHVSGDLCGKLAACLFDQLVKTGKPTSRI